MRKLALGLIVAMLLVPSVVGAWGSVMVGGGVAEEGGCDSCSSTTDSQLLASATTFDNSAGGAQTFWWAWQFTTIAETCITGVTWYVSDNAAAGMGAVGEVYTNSSGSPGTRYGDGFTKTISDVGYSAEPEYTEFLFSATQTLPAGTYWVLFKPTSGAILAGEATSKTGTVKFSNDSGASWNETTWELMIGIIGCE